jgi:hypothetical protein
MSAQDDLSRATWYKSKYSGENGGCVAVTLLDDGSVALQDTKNPDGPVLVFHDFEWDNFIADAKDGGFDRASLAEHLSAAGA